MNKFSENPVNTAGSVQALINAFIVLLIAFDLVGWNDSQIASVLGIANVIGSMWGSWWVQRNTTTLADPKTKEGTPLVPVADAKPVTRGY